MKCILALNELSSMDHIDIENANRLIQIMKKELANIEFSDLDKSVNERIDAKKRKYGSRGELMGHLGYYNPSIIIDRIYDNVKRGQLTGKSSSRARFTYDYDQNGNVIKIANRVLSSVSFCERQGRYICYVSYDMQSGDKPEIVSVVLVENEDHSMVKKWVQVGWLNHMKIALSIDAEIYSDLQGQQICTRYEGRGAELGCFEGFAIDTFRINGQLAHNSITVEWL